MDGAHEVLPGERYRWSVRDRTIAEQHRTNNALEGYNNRLGVMIPINVIFLTWLQKEEANTTKDLFTD
jgi:hypothetical protein